MTMRERSLEGTGGQTGFKLDHMEPGLGMTDLDISKVVLEIGKLGQGLVGTNLCWVGDGGSWDLEAS